MTLPTEPLKFCTTITPDTRSSPVVIGVTGTLTPAGAPLWMEVHGTGVIVVVRLTSTVGPCA